MTTTFPVFKISPGINEYDWGKKGSASLAAQLAEVSIPGFQVKENGKYSELWMGTHPTLPSHVASSSTSDSTESQTLAAHLKSHPELIGDKILNAFPDAKDGALPFLFKVLSIGTALSIQAHPDKELAKKLHAERPNIYKDPNHKPEMAIALTPFLAFLNFLPLPSLLLHLLSTPELDALISPSLRAELASSLLLPDSRPPTALLYSTTQAPATAEQKDLLKRIFGALMSAPDDQVKAVIGQIKERYQANEGLEESERGVRELFLILDEQYPGDVGVLCVYLLNVVELKVGEAAFLGADMPHAYISGNIIECMATSDNVVRAGLTPKLRDVDTLVSMLTYEASPGSKQLLKPTGLGGGSGEKNELYDPPIQEFSVVRLALANGETQAQRAIEGPSIGVVVRGNGRVTWGAGGGAGADDEDAGVEVRKGEVVFLGCGVEATWAATEGGEAGEQEGEEQGLEVFRAFVEA